MTKLISSCLLAAAAATCCDVAQAQNSVTLSGLVDVFAGSLQNAGDPGKLKVVNPGGMTTSFFGFSAIEDLGGGLKASVVLNAFFRNDTGAVGRFNGDPFFARDAYVALAGSYGTLSLGRGKAPNFLPTVFANPFGDSFTFSPLILHANINTARWPYSTTPSDTGWGNQVVYGTPSFGGLVANLQYQFGEQTSNVSDVSGRKNVGANLLYTSGSLSLVAFYERDQITDPNPSLITVPVNGVATPTTRKDWMVGGSYNAGFAKAYASYGQSKTDLSNFEGKTSSLGVTVPVGVGFILADVARTKASGAFNGTRTTGSVGYDYFLSKRTDLYAVALQDRVTDLNKGNTFALGVRHRF